MRMILCAGACALACLHAFAAAVHLKEGQRSPNDRWMIVGAALAALGGILCLMGIGVDWLAALAGFSLIAAAAIGNGRQKQQMHISHHIVRISLFALIVIGLFLV